MAAAGSLHAALRLLCCITCGTSLFACLRAASAQVVYFEVMSNSSVGAFDIRLVVPMAHAAGATVIVDNSALSPAIFRPLCVSAPAATLRLRLPPPARSACTHAHLSTRCKRASLMQHTRCGVQLTPEALQPDTHDPFVGVVVAADVVRRRHAEWRPHGDMPCRWRSTPCGIRRRLCSLSLERAVSAFAD